MNRNDGWIDELVAAQPPGWSLATPFYTDPEIFLRDRERVFARQWIMAGHLSQIPIPGDYFLFDLAGDSLIITRGPDGAVHALHNVCRHRGSRVLLAPAGRARTMTCTYHGWSYACDGTLRAAPRMPATFERGSFGLHRCAVTVLEGLIFVCLSEDGAPDMAAVSEGLAPFLRLQGSAGAKIARRTIYPVAANWKLVVENYLECYHCKTAHPEYCAVEIKAEKIGDGGPAGMAAWAERMAQWQPLAETQGSWLPEFCGVSATPGAFFGAAYRAPLRANHETASRDGQPVAPLLPGFNAFDGGETALGAGPCTYMLAYNDYLAFFQFVPRDAISSDMIVTWLVSGEAVEGRDYDPDRVAWLWHVTSEQDKAIIENNAAGVASPAYRPGPPSLLEGDVEGFRHWYLETISPGAGRAAKSGAGDRYFPARMSEPGR